MRAASLVAGSVLCATLGAADLGVLSIVVVPQWLEPGPVASDAEQSVKAPSPQERLAAAERTPTERAQAEPPKAEEPVRAPIPPEPEARVEPRAEPHPNAAADSAPTGRRAQPPPEPAEDAVDVSGTDGKEPTAPSSAGTAAEPLVVRFELERADVGPQVRAQLSELVSSLRAGDRVRVEGHADMTGREDGNRYFSRERAKAVARELLRLGVALPRITMNSFGSTRPLVPARTPAANERNRRVEIYVDRSGR